MLLKPLGPRSWQLRYLMQSTIRGRDQALKKARARKADHGEVQWLEQDWYMEYQMLDDEYEEIFTRTLEKEADRLRVPVPERPYFSESRQDENWAEGQYGGGWHLKPEGVKKVRAEIRAERLARTEHRVRWLNPLIGLFGALAGLAGAAAALLALLA